MAEAIQFTVILLYTKRLCICIFRLGITTVPKVSAHNRVECAGDALALTRRIFLLVSISTVTDTISWFTGYEQFCYDRIVRIGISMNVVNVYVLLKAHCRTYY